MKKIIIIDGNSLANRAFYAMPYLSNRNKQPSGAVFGFANLIVKLIVEQKPDYVAVAFDHARQTFRNEIYQDYKGKRKETPPDLLSQFPVIKQMLQTMGIKIFEFAGIEADDIIGTISKHSNIQNILVSGDRDLLQLIDDNSSVWLTRKGVTEIEVFDEKSLFEKYKLKPSGIIELKALMGDASDNIPGVAGVGEKTALSLLEKYQNLDGIYENIEEVTGKLKEKLIAGKDMAYMSKTLATIKTDCEIDFDIESCSYTFPFSQAVRDFFEEWDFRSLMNRRDLFGEGVRTNKKEVKKTVFEDLSQVENFKGKIKNFLCYDLKKMEFAIDGNEVFYVKKEIDLFSNVIDFDDVLKILKSVFESKVVTKITNCSKEDMKILDRVGITLENFFDVDIARYVLFAGLPKLPEPEVQDYINLKVELEKQMVEQKVEKVYTDIEIPLVRVLASMEEEGFKVDEKMLDELSQKYDAELADLTTKIYELAGENFNINSPKQVAHILFDKLTFDTLCETIARK